LRLIYFRFVIKARDKKSARQQARKTGLTKPGLQRQTHKIGLRKKTASRAAFFRMV
jgi:hypothetical protein